MKRSNFNRTLINRVTRRFGGEKVKTDSVDLDLNFKTKSPRPLVIEALEPRVLFSGSPTPAPEPATDTAPASQEATAPESTAEDAPASEESAVAAPPEQAAATEGGGTGEGAPAQQPALGEADQTVTAFSLTQEEVAAVAEAALERWVASGVSEEQADALAGVDYQIADLDGNRVAAAEGNLITIDTNAAGRGWFVDSTPLEDGEFSLNGSVLIAADGGGAAGKIDLLTAILHEQGHVLGIADGGAGELMFEYLGTSERRLPEEGLADGAVAGSATEAEYLTVLGTGTGALLGNDLFDQTALHASAPVGNANVIDNRTDTKQCCSGVTNAIDGQGQANMVILNTPVVLTHWTIASGHDAINGCCIGRNPDVFFIQGSNDGNTWTNIFEYNNDGTHPFSANQQVILYQGGGVDFATPDAYTHIRYFVDSTITDNQYQLAEVELFGVAAIDDTAAASEDGPVVGFNVKTAPAEVLGISTNVEIESGASGFGGSTLGTLNDGFAYDPLNPTGALPNQSFGSGNGFHNNNTNSDATLVYTLKAPVSLGTTNEVVVDLYGRGNCCTNRDDNIDFQFLDSSGAVLGTLNGVKIDGAAKHLRVSTNDLAAPLALGTQVGGFRVIGHNIDNDTTNSFTLMEVRAAELTTQLGEPDFGVNIAIDSIDTTGTMGTVTLVDPGGLVSYDPNGQFEYLSAGVTATDTFTYTASSEIPGTLGTYSGRFIKVENNEFANRSIAIGEIEAFTTGVAPAANFDNTNDLALTSKGASVEAVVGSGGHGSPDATIDGSEQTGGSTFNRVGVGASIMIDLGSTQDLERIRIHQRNDCCWERLENFTVSILADDGGAPGDVVASTSFEGRVPNSLFSDITFPKRATDIAEVTVTITGVNDVPEFATSSVSVDVDENSSNTTVLHTASATDIDNGDSVTYSIASVGDAPFSVDSTAFAVDAGGNLTFVAPPDYEAPTDNGGDNIYNVAVRATDQFGGIADQNVTVTVNDLDGAIGPANPDDGTGDALTVVLNGDNVEFYDGTTLIGSEKLSQLSQITLQGSGDDDTFTIDFDGGLFGGKPIVVHGGNDSGGGDELIITGDPGGIHKYTYTGSDGTGFKGDIDIDGQAISFTGLEPITDSDPSATAYEFILPAGADTATLVDNGGGSFTLDAPTFETTTFSTTGATSVTITGGSDDSVTLTSATTNLTFDLSITAGDIDLPNAVNLGANTLTVDIAGTGGTAAGVISGTGGSLVKDGVGTFTVSNRANSYTGGTNVDGGKLTLNGANNASSLVGTGLVTINSGGQIDAHVNAFGISYENEIHINGGILNSVGADSHLNKVTMSGGQLTGQEFRLHEDFIINGATSSVINAGTIRFYDDIEFAVGDGAAAKDLIVSSKVINGAGSNALFKSGSGTMELTADNEYTGGTTVNDSGTLLLGGSDNSVGTIRGTLTVNSGATVDYTANNSFGWDVGQSVNVLHINGGTVGGADFRNHFWNSFQLNMDGGTLLLGGSNNEFNDATVTVTGGVSSVIQQATGATGAVMRLRNSTDINFNTVTAADSLTVSAPITGQTAASDVFKNGLGTLTLSGANTFDGNVVVNAGLLKMDHVNALGSTAGGTTVNGGGALDLNGTNFNAPNVAENFTIGGTGTDGAGGSGAVFSSTNGAQFDDGSTITLGSDAEIGGGASRIDNYATINGGGNDLTKVGGENWWNWAGSASNIGTLNVDASAFLGIGDTALANAATSVHVKDSATLMTWGDGQNFTSDMTFENGSQFRNHWGVNLTSTHQISGDVTLNGTTIFSDNGDSRDRRTLTISGAINGAGGLTKQGNSNLIFSGSGSNTYAGETKVENAGVLTLNKSGGAVAVAGNITFGSGSGQGFIRTSQDNQFGATTVMDFINPWGEWSRFDLQGTTQTLAGVQSTGAGGVIQNAELSFGGSIGDGVGTLVINNTADYSFGGHFRNLNGTLELVKNGVGTFTLERPAGQTSRTDHTGTTTVNVGRLVLDAVDGYRSATTVNSGAVLELAGSVNWAGAAGFSVTLNDATLDKTNTGYNTFNSSNVSVSGASTINVTNDGSDNQMFIGGGGTGLTGTGTLTINNTGTATTGITLRSGVNATHFDGDMTVNGGVLNVSSGAGLALDNTDLTLSGASLNTNGAWAATTGTDASVKSLAGDAASSVVFGARTLTIGTNDGTGGNFAGLIADTGSIIKVGTGTQTLSGTGLTYSGTTTVSDGTLSLQMAGSGTGFNSAVDVASGAVLDLTSTNTAVDNWLFDTAITGVSGSDITKNGTGWVQVLNTGGLGGFLGTVTINDGIFGNGFNAVGDWTGSTADVVANGSGVLDLRTDDITIDTLSGDGVVANTFSVLDPGDVNTLTLGVDGGSAEFSGTIFGAGGGALNSSYDAGGIEIVKTGIGTQILSGTSTYLGTTEVQMGTLQLDGDHTGGRQYTVSSGATLSGTGTTDADVVIDTGGTLAPGQSPGVIATGDLDIDGNYDVEVAGFDGAGDPNGHDQTVVTGLVDLDTGTSLLNLDITGLTAAEMNTAVPGELVIIDNDGTADPVIGNFSNAAEGTVVASNVDGTLLDLVVTYRGGDGNDVSLIAGNLTTRIFSSGNDLVIEDISDVTADQLTVEVVGGNLVVTEADTDILIDAQGVFDGATGDLSNQVTIGLGTFTGDVILRTGDGDDDIIFEDMDLTGTRGITVEDGAGTDTVTFQGADSVLGGGDVDVTADSIAVDAAVDSGGGDVTLTSDGAISTTAAISAGGGDITLGADGVAIGASVSSSGALTIAPRTASATIGVGGGAGTLEIDDAEIAFLADGFSLITIGDAAAGDGAVDVDSSLFADEIRIVGGSISVTGLAVAAPGDEITLTARTGAITDGGDAAQDITGNRVFLNAGGDIGADAPGDEIALSAGQIVTDSTLDGANGNQFLSESGTITEAGFDAGTGTVTMQGSGTFRLTDNSVADLTSLVVEDGADFNVNGRTDTFVSITVNAGGLLRGTGTLDAAVIVNDGGSVEPGPPNPRTIATGDLTLNNGGTYGVDLTGAGPDQLAVTGTVTIDDATLDLENLPGTYSPGAGDTFVIIDNDGTADAVVGTFDGLAEGTYVSVPISVATEVPDELFQISYLGTSGTDNDVVLTATGRTVTTHVYIDGDGNLVVDDIDGKDTDDDLRISYDSTLMAFVVEELTAPNTLGTLIVGATQTTPNRIEVPVSLVTGGLIVDTLGGDDTITLGGLGTLDGHLTVLGGGGFDRIVQEAGATVALTDAGAGANAPGAATYTAEVIRMDAGSSLATAGGAVTFTANAGGASGTFAGVELDGATVTTGTGDVTLAGRGGDTGSGGYGVLVHNDTATGARSTVDSGGSLTISGTGGGDRSRDGGVGVFASDLSSAGAASLTGTGSTSSTSDTTGVLLSAGSTLVSGGGIALDGTGGTGRYGVGVAVNSSSLEASGGDLAIDGRGGGTGGSGTGVALSASSVEASGGGDVAIGGTASGGAGSRYDVGVSVHVSSVSSAGGDIAVSGRGAGASGAGVKVTASSALSTSGAGALSVTGTGSGGDGVFFNGSSAAAGTGGITVAGTAAGARASGGVSLSLGSFSAGGAVGISGQGAGAGKGGAGVAAKGFDISGDTVSIAGTGSAAGSSSAGGVAVASSDITASGGAAGADSITISGAGGGSAKGNHGFHASSAAIAATGAGNVSIAGTGGGGSGGNGLYLAASSVTSASGDISLGGTSTGASSKNRGVYAAGSTVGAGGDLTLTGTSSGTSYATGVDLSVTDISAGASASIAGTSGGTAGRSSGVSLGKRSSVSAGDAVTIAGTGGSGGSSNYGVVAGSRTSVSAGAGGITVAGSGGAGASNNAGVLLGSGSSLDATAGGGDIAVTGTGAGSAKGNRGIYALRSSIATSGAGTISAAGTGSAGASGKGNSGVLLQTSSLSTGGGDITLAGDGGTGSASRGVRATAGSTLDAGAGLLDVDGTSNGTAGNYNSGVDISGASLSDTGTIAGTAGAGASRTYGIFLNRITGFGSGTTLTADDEGGDFFNLLPAALAAGAAADRRPGQSQGKAKAPRRAAIRGLSGLLGRLPRTGAGGATPVFRLAGGLLSPEPAALIARAGTAGTAGTAGATGARRVILLEGGDADPLRGFSAELGEAGEILSTAPLEAPLPCSVGDFLAAAAAGDSAGTPGAARWADAPSDTAAATPRISLEISRAFGLE